jgi:hypothetical protein
MHEEEDIRVKLFENLTGKNTFRLQMDVKIILKGYPRKEVFNM